MSQNKYKRFIAPALLAVALCACDSEGIDRDELNAAQQNDAVNGTTTSLPLNVPNRFVQLNKLQFEVTDPSIVSVLFQATDQFDNALTGLRIGDFQLLEDNQPVSATETSLSIVPHEQLPFSLRTVIMIDVSSSISPANLETVKAAVSNIITTPDGQSKLLPQQEVALYTFDDTVQLVRDFSSNAAGLVDSLNSIPAAVALTPTDFFGAAITGAGRIEDSLDIQQIAQGNVIIITDGTDTAARNTFSDAIAAVAGKSVYALGVGDEISADTLDRIGTRGTFALQNYEQLNSVLSSINQQVVDRANSLYYLHYASPKRAAENGGNSIHNIELSVVNNANAGRGSTINDSFDATDFSNVQAQVVISGPGRLEAQQTATYSAVTRWGPQVVSDYLWSLPEDNSTCQLSQLNRNTAQVTAVSGGNCTITAEDQTAGGVQGWFSIAVSID